MHSMRFENSDTIQTIRAARLALHTLQSMRFENSDTTQSIRAGHDHSHARLNKSEVLVLTAQDLLTVSP